MPKVTAIKPQKNKKRVNIYLDNKFGFGLDLENFVKFGIKLEQELSQKSIENIIKSSEFQKTHDKLLRYVTLRPRSVAEVNLWLKKHKVHKSVHNDLFNKLERYELIDDMEFAKWWVEQRKQFKPRGEKALRSELFQKGIEKEIINEVLENTCIDEERIAKDLLKRYAYKWERLESSKKREKMTNYLARKGISWDAIKKAIKKELV